MIKETGVLRLAIRFVAYGFPLAAYVKSIGKKAIHLGGAVANMFGVKSKQVEQSTQLSMLVNKYWISPNENETPQNFHQVEGGLYW